MSTLAYEIVDVFTDRPFTGNPLAVVYGADGLDTGQLQALAREFNLSETVFLLPAQAAGADYRVRIFTPRTELPFAGHPSVGAALCAVRRGIATPDQQGQLVQECGIGLLPLVVSAHTATLTGGTPTLGAPVDLAAALAAVGLPASAHTGPEPRTAGCGLNFAYLPVRPAAVAEARLDPAAALAADLPELCVFALAPDGPAGLLDDRRQRQVHARVFCPGSGIIEDPATGSAALGLATYLVGAGVLPADDTTTFTVRQGLELHRPSTLTVQVTAVGGVATQATVTGAMMPVARGEIAVPPFVG